MALQKELFKKKEHDHFLPPAPRKKKVDSEEEEDGLGDLEFSSQNSLKNRHSHNIDPVEWDKYFEFTDTFIPEGTQNKFQLYKIGDFSKKSGTLFILHHGGGHSSLSWALCASEMKKMAGKSDLCILAYDCRGHGKTYTDNDSDLSLSTMSNDLVLLINEMFADSEFNIVLVGHSMGGAVVIDAAASKKIKISGLVVVDVVEGTAMEAISGTGMMRFLESRPPVFNSLSEAIHWSVRAGIVRNLESAQVSMPGQLVQIKNPRTDDPKMQQYTWRTDLFATEKFWKEWYTNMSDKFLSVTGPKLLLLAGTDRLDRELTIGQMQGKFQLAILPQSGHIVQEDSADQVAQQLINFSRHFEGIDIAAIRARTLNNAPSPSSFLDK